MSNPSRQTIGLAASLAFAATLAACGHSDGFGTPTLTPLGPRTTGPDVQLTYNADQDYWPAWTEDGRGILYSFVDPGSAVRHRCVGLILAGGGQRAWQLCDNRATQVDSNSSFSGYALDSAGRVLYAETASNSTDITPLPKTTLWLADTAAPFARTALLTLPITTPSTVVTSLAEIRWTARSSFTALGQLFETIAHCFPHDALYCPQQDSMYFGGGVVLAGTIAGGQATMAAIGGTEGATNYSLAEGGASVVFTRLHDLHLFKVAVTGGTATAVATIPQGSVAEILGVSCQGSTCVVSSAPVVTVHPEVPAHPQINGGLSRLDAVALATGAIQSLLTIPVSAATLNSPPQPIYSTAHLSPGGTDVVMQVGGTWWGHLQTYYGGGNADLYLYPAIVH